MNSDKIKSLHDRRKKLGLTRKQVSGKAIGFVSYADLRNFEVCGCSLSESQVLFLDNYYSSLEV